MNSRVENGDSIVNADLTCTSDAEGKLLFELAKNVPGEQVIVEISGVISDSTFWLAKGSMEGNSSRIYSIYLGADQNKDTNADGKNMRARLIANLEAMGAKHVVNSYMDTDSITRRWTEPIGLLYINTSHEYEGVKKVLLDWECHLSPGAKVIMCGCNQPGPTQVIKEITGELGNFIFEQVVDNVTIIAADICIHYWVIDSNEQGVCRHCGRVRNFKRMMREATKKRGKRIQQTAKRQSRMGK